MKEALRSVEAYEAFVYSIKDRYPAIEVSTLVVVRRGPHHAQLQGFIQFARDIVLHVYERIDFVEYKVAYYSYEVQQGESTLSWYDPQPHPDDVTLVSTHPHHKHIPPDIKYHRIPAAGLSFDRPNLPFLIEEIVAMLRNNPNE